MLHIFSESFFCIKIQTIFFAKFKNVIFHFRLLEILVISIKTLAKKYFFKTFKLSFNVGHINTK